MREIGRGQRKALSGSTFSVHHPSMNEQSGGRLSLDEQPRSHSPVDSLGTATGVFGTPGFRSRRASASSTVSSFLSGPTDREGHGRSNSFHRRVRLSKQLPKMLSPPQGPPPSIPTSQSQPTIASERTSQDLPRSRTSSLRSRDFHVAPNGVNQNSRRMSTSAVSTGSTNSHQRPGDFLSGRKLPSSALPKKRVSMPPPPRPAPTFALPPTPSQADASSSTRASDASGRKASFRQSFSPRALRFSLSPPPNKALPPRPDEPSFNERSNGHRRSLSSELTRSSSNPHVISPSPRGPPPLGPLPPTPQETTVVSRHTSFKERLRMRSAPSTPPPDIARFSSPPSTSNSRPLVPIQSIPSLKNEERRQYAIGEPISDLNFLNMSGNELSGSSHDVDFLNMSSPVSTTSPMPIPSKADRSTSTLADPPEASPPSVGVTVLPPPPRRTKLATPVHFEDQSDEPRTPETPLFSTGVDDHVRKHFDASISRDTFTAI